MGQREQRIREGSEGTPKERFTGSPVGKSQAGAGAGPGAQILPAVYVGGTVSLKKSGQGRDTVQLEGAWELSASCPHLGRKARGFSSWGCAGPDQSCCYTEVPGDKDVQGTRTDRSCSDAVPWGPAEAWVLQETYCSLCEAQRGPRHASCSSLGAPLLPSMPPLWPGPGRVGWVRPWAPASLVPSQGGTRPASSALASGS